MDPNATLDIIRETRAAFDAGQLDPTEAAESLAESFDALDKWLSRGGFLPTDWERK